MNDDTRSFLRSVYKSLGHVSSIGLSMAIAIAIGVFIGVQLDRWIGTKHVFFYIFLLIGIAAGFRNVFILARREMKQDDKGEGDNGSR